MITQLNPPIPLTTPKGDGYAHFLIDYSQEHNLMWVVFLDGTGECWTFQNPEIRAQKNITLGRKVGKSDAEKTHEAAAEVRLSEQDYRWEPSLGWVMR